MIEGTLSPSRSGSLRKARNAFHTEESLGDPLEIPDGALAMAALYLMRVERLEHRLC